MAGHEHEQVAELFTQEFWDERYAGAPVWSGNPNWLLVTHAEDLAPGAALDIGCGEGADAVWLAERGWTVTAVDVSPVALGRGADRAAAAGVGGRITWRQADAFTWVPPEQAYDLVSAQYVHPPLDRRVGLHRGLAAAVRTGGTLLLVGHHPDDGLHRPYPAQMFPTAEQMAEVLDTDRWTVETGAPEREVEGQRLREALLRAVRRS